MAKRPASVVARMRRSSGIMTKIEVKTAGISMPPQKPCTTRIAIRMPMVGAKAQPRLARIKPSVAATNIQRKDSARVRIPVRGMAITSAIR